MGPRLQARLAKRLARSIRSKTLIGEALSGAPHPGRARILEHLRAVSLHDPSADPREEVGRFVRDHLFGLQLYRFSTLSAGLLALGLAAAAILRDLPADAAHPEARTRILLWEQALTAIGFLDPASPKKLMPRLNQLFNRAQLAPEEIHILRGVAKAMIEAAGAKR